MLQVGIKRLLHNYTAFRKKPAARIGFIGSTCAQSKTRDCRSRLAFPRLESPITSITTKRGLTCCLAKQMYIQVHFSLRRHEHTTTQPSTVDGWMGLPSVSQDAAPRRPPLCQSGIRELDGQE